jgi:hypothetical protein
MFAAARFGEAPPWIRNARAANPGTSAASQGLGVTGARRSGKDKAEADDSPARPEHDAG